MALKGLRHEFYTTTRYFVNDVAEEGTFVALSGSGATGVGYDNSVDVAYVPTSTVSGVKAVGMLLTNFVNIDLTRYRLNDYRNEQLIGTKANILKKGWAYTNMISGTPVAGSGAYLCLNGKVSPTQLTSAPQVGQFQSRADADGFALVEIAVSA